MELDFRWDLVGFAVASVTVARQGKSRFVCSCSCGCCGCSFGRGFECTACGARSVNARAGTRDIGGGSGSVRGWGKGH